MSRITLFDGGRAGGILMNANGVRTVPRFAPEIIANLSAVADLLRAARNSATEEYGRDLLALANKVSNIAVERIEAAIGTLDPEDSLVFLDANDGFVCGSSGAPPRTIKWPPRGGSESRELRATDILSPDLISFLAQTSAHDIKLTEVLEDPLATAKKINFKLSSLDAQTLEGLAPSRLASISDPIEREVVSFFHGVLEDGRFLETWNIQPVAVAQAINVTLSFDAIDRILGGSALVGNPGNVANLSIEQGIVVGIVAILVLTPRLGDNVIDFSGKEKF